MPDRPTTTTAANPSVRDPITVTTVACLNKRPYFTPEEVNTLLDIIDEKLPTTTQEWKTVTEALNAKYPDVVRHAKNVQRKFNTVVNKR